MKITKLFIPLILLICLGCSVFTPLDDDSILLDSIKTDKFKSFFKLCNKKEDKIVIYNNLNAFKDSLSSNIDCNKTLLVLKSNIKIDVNSSSRIRDSKIVLYQYEIIGNKFKISFIETATNATLIMIFDKKKKLISANSGVF
jgi:hypothetical protein